MMVNSACLAEFGIDRQVRRRLPRGLPRRTRMMMKKSAGYGRNPLDGGAKLPPGYDEAGQSGSDSLQSGRDASWNHRLVASCLGVSL